MDLTDIYRVYHPVTAQNAFFSTAHGTFSKTYHNLVHKSCLNKYKKIEIAPYILSDQNSIKLEINNKRNSRKYPNTCSLDNTLLHDEWVIEEIGKKSKKFLEFNKNKSTTY
jgi:hypothetical protein